MMIGDEVIYRPRAGQEERGIVTHISGEHVFVRFGDDLHSKATRAEDLEPAPEPLTFTCPSCGRTSHNPNDVRGRYCAACGEFYPER